MRTRGAVILGLGGAAGASAFTVGLRQWRTRSALPDIDLLPLPLNQMEFELIDQRRCAVRPADGIGRPTMVFFGFTGCPDICAITLGDISGWLEGVRLFGSETFVGNMTENVIFFTEELV